MQNNRPTNNPSFAHQRQVRVREESAGGGEVDPASSDCQVGVLVLQVSNFTSGGRLCVQTVLVHTLSKNFAVM